MTELHNPTRMGTPWREPVPPPMPQARRQTLEDLHRYDGKAEFIGGRIVEFPVPGDRPVEIADNILGSLRPFAKRTGAGRARGDGLDYLVPQLRSGRQSFRPDGSFYTQAPPPDGMNFVQGPPTFAVEVRSKTDYGPAAEEEMAAKRADYFEAGTLAVWDVDPEAAEVRLYLKESPAVPTVFRKGQSAHAGPAVPGWSMTVDEVFA
jgi:Uma2 family endonuclease